MASPIFCFKNGDLFIYYFLSWHMGWGRGANVGVVGCCPKISPLPHLGEIVTLVTWFLSLDLIRKVSNNKTSC